MTDTPKARFMYDADVPVWEQVQRRAKANDERRVRRNNTRRLNAALYELGRTYHQSVPLDTINELLRIYGFDPLDAMLLCGRSGRLHDSVGHNRWLSLTWYKMEESGRYEVIAYIS